MESKTVNINRNSVTVFRILLSLIFIVASINHLFNIEKVISKINQARLKELAHIFGNPEFSVVASGVVMLIAGIALMIGFKTKYAALILALVLLPITITTQVGQMSTIGPLFKNVAIFGGLIFFIMNNFNNHKTIKA
ncbi:MAG: DoxX family membrane protein [Bacteroidota bacterium]|nr:DoxX family membrane protein [Bacteroidota bacterium]